MITAYCSPRIWYEAGVYHLNSSAKHAVASSVGHATARSLGSWFKDPRNPIIDAASTRWVELEWGTAMRVDGHWFLLTTAWFDDGRLVLWRAE